MAEEEKTQSPGWVAAIAWILGLVYMYFKKRYSKEEQRKKRIKEALREIKRIDEALFRGDMDEVAIAFLKLRRKIQAIVAGIKDD